MLRSMDILNGIATESAGVLTVGTSGPPEDGIFRDVTLISEGWGQSGYYDGEMLHRDGPTTLTKGLRVFSDHADGPVESSKNVMGVLVSEARPAVNAKTGKRELRGDIRVFKTGPYNHEWAYERASAGAIELSIRSHVKYGSGTREGRYGKVVTAMTEGLSVDVVARGGAGGSFGTIQESKPIGVDDQQNQEGSEMPLSQEELTALAQESAKATAAALAPALAGITTALTGLAQENKKVDAPVALAPSEIRSKIAGAKLAEKSVDRVYVAIESAEVATKEVVESVIAAETARVEEIAAEAKALAEDKGGNFQQKTNDEIAAEAYVPGSIGAWKVEAA